LLNKLIGGKMADSKYGKHIITELKQLQTPREGTRLEMMPSDFRQSVRLINGEMLEGAFFSSAGWIWKAYPDRVWVPAHTHSFDETINFFGSNPDDVNDLCGEIEIWLEDEKFTITKSCIIFAPAGMKHCPITVKRVDRPIFSFLSSTAVKYDIAMSDT
jgi:hypothetical protein